MRAVPFLVELAVIVDSYSPLAGLSTGAANTRRIGSRLDRPQSVNPPACDQARGGSDSGLGEVLSGRREQA
jgi:hypothetical protein